MTALYRGPKKGYKLTEADTQMLAKSLWGENGSEMTEEAAGAIAWSMLNRYLLINYKWMQVGWSFEKFVQSFSQPVNPKWLDPNGEMCRRRPGDCTESRINRRRRIQGASWTAVKRISPDGVRYARMFADGQLPNPFPEPIYDFASKKRVLSQGFAGPGITIGGNTFLRYSDLKEGDLKNAVVAGEVHTGTAAYKAAWAAVAFAALGAASAWLLERYGDDIANFTKRNLKS